MQSLPLSTLSPPSGPLCWDPRFCLPPPQHIPTNTQIDLQIKILHALSCFSALFIVSFLEELFASPLIHPKKKITIIRYFKHIGNVTYITIYLPFSFVKQIFTFCHICFIPFDRKIVANAVEFPLYFSTVFFMFLSL